MSVVIELQCPKCGRLVVFIWPGTLHRHCLHCHRLLRFDERRFKLVVAERVQP